jgi:hypothetical protein
MGTNTSFIKDKIVRAHKLNSKQTNTSEHGVAYLRVKLNIDLKEEGDATCPLPS